MRDLPVEHTDHAIAWRNHEIAIAEIVVHQGQRRLGRQIVEQPARGVVDHRLWRDELLVITPLAMHKGGGGKRFEMRTQIVGIEVDGMNARQDLAALIGEARADGGELLAFDDACAQRFAAQPFHQEAVAQTVASFEHVQDGGRRHAARAGQGHESRFDMQARATIVARVDGTARRATQGETARAVAGRDVDGIGFLTRAAR